MILGQDRNRIAKDQVLELKMGEKEAGGRGNGYAGQILNIDLSEGSTERESLPDDFYRKYLGGVGLGARLLWDRIRPGIDPMGPDNLLCFTTGLLTDTGSLFSGRFMVMGKSPLTNGWGEANCGGYFSPLLKRCGLDAILVSGASKEPVYLYLDENGSHIRPADDLWGKDALETERILKERYGKAAQVACIGPAGEKLSFIAGISNDGGRYAARSGLGGVMGSKRLKAIVAKGKAKIVVADKEKIKSLTQGFRKRLKGMEAGSAILGDNVGTVMGWMSGKPFYTKQPALAWRLILKRYGTPGVTTMCVETGDTPVKNWGGAVRPDFPRKKYLNLGARALMEYKTKSYGCYSCPARCGDEMKVQDGPYPIEKTHKPEYETIASFGPMLLNDDLPSVFKVNDLCNRGGVDTISCGGVVAFAIECFENGLITTEDTDGLELKWGNSKDIVALTEKIINREGFGDLLADGVKRAAQRIGKGSEKYAVHCGGQEAPMHDPKLDPGYGMVYLCDAAPARHTTTGGGFLELQSLEKKFSKAPPMPALSTMKSRHKYEEQGEGIAVGLYFKMLVDSAGICIFGTQVGGDIPITEWMNAATGWSLTNDQYLEIGERIAQLRHSFNTREGINPSRDFGLHPRLTGKPALEAGPLKKVSLDPEALARTFYQATHKDPETGKVDRERLVRLGLEDVAQEIHGE
jgi:aldehyde:ferredoxin oxidoreductase